VSPLDPIRDVGGADGAEAEVADEAVFKAVDPAVDGEVLFPLPGAADDGGFADVEGLLEDVQLAEAVEAFFGLVDAVEGLLVALLDIADVAEPVIGEADLVVVEDGLDAAAAVMADDHDVLDFQDIDGELKDGEAVEIGVDDDVGNVAMDEDFAGGEIDDLGGWDAAVGAADPHVFGSLLVGEVFEEIGVDLADAGGPVAVALEEFG